MGPFCPNLGKNKFSCKKGLCQFLNIRIIYHCAKNQLNLMSHSWENCWTDIPKTSLQFIISLISSWDTANFRAQSHWPRAFWVISQEPEFAQIWNLFKYTTITITETVIIDQIEKKLKNWEKKLNFPIHSRNPRFGLFSPYLGQNIIFKKSGFAIHNTTWTPNLMLSSRKN